MTDHATTTERAAALLAGDLQARDALADALWHADGYVESVLEREDCHTQDMRERADAVIEWLQGGARKAST